MAPGLVSEGFLIYPTEIFTLVLHVLLQELPNSQATQGGSFLICLSFLGIIPLLDNLRRNLKEQCFILWCQTMSYLSSCTKMSLVDHILATYSFVRSAPTIYFSTSSKLVGIWYGISVGVRRYSPDSSISSWPKIRIFQVSTQEASLVSSSRVENMGGSDPFYYLTISSGDRCPMEPYLVGEEGSDRTQKSF